MDSYRVFQQAENLVQRYGTRNTCEIAEQSGIWVYKEPLGDLLGMYTYQLKHRIILLNSKLDVTLEQMVCAHEIGHDRLHRHESKDAAFKEFTLFNITNNSMEYEANAFASHILLDNAEVLSLVKEGRDVSYMAQVMNTDINIMLIKLQELGRLGYKFNLPLDPDSRFFRKIKASGIANYDYAD